METSNIFSVIVGMFTIIGVFYAIKQFYKKDTLAPDMKQSGIGNTQKKKITYNIDSNKNEGSNK